MKLSNIQYDNLINKAKLNKSNKKIDEMIQCNAAIALINNHLSYLEKIIKDFNLWDVSIERLLTEFDDLVTLQYIPSIVQSLIKNNNTFLKKELKSIGFNSVKIK